MSDVICGIAGIAAAIFVVRKLSQPSKLDGIPTVGSSSRLVPWWIGSTYITNMPDVLQEGYAKHESTPFKVADFHGWTVILSSRKHVEELRRAPDETLSFTAAKMDMIQEEYTIGPETLHNPYHVSIVSSQLTRSIGALYPDVRDEISTAFYDVLDLIGNGRDPDWVDLNVQYSLEVVRAAAIIRLFPELLKPIAARFLTNIHQLRQRARKLLGPIFEGRQKLLTADKPNDFLSWLMEEAEGPESTVELLTTRTMLLNMAAIHTSSQSFTHALFYLAANPQYIQPLREEIETIVEREGWSKAALGKMRKVDSFMKECQRLEGIGSASLARKALKDFTFSGGTFIPKGTVVAAAARPIHYDEAFYKNAHTFEPFRFAEMREQEGVKHHFVSTTTEYLPFGHGRRACPGRFFAASELKSMLVHVVVTYDVKLADNATRPRTLHFGLATLPDPSAEVMFRRRVD